MKYFLICSVYVPALGVSVLGYWKKIFSQTNEEAVNLVWGDFLFVQSDKIKLGIANISAYWICCAARDQFGMLVWEKLYVASSS